MPLLARLRAVLLDLLFPSGAVCLHCGRLAHGELLCPDCREGLEHALLTDVCPACGALRDDDQPCPRCAEGWRYPARAPWRHRDLPAFLVHQLKDGGVEDAARVMAPYLAQAARDLDLQADTVIAWVPMPDDRRRERGIDHARLLAEHTAAILGLPCRMLLTRVGTQHTQRGLDRAERLVNVQHAFAAQGPAPERVLLIDDVLTTGATMTACAAALESAGASHISVLTAVQAAKGG